MGEGREGPRGGKEKEKAGRRTSEESGSREGNRRQNERWGGGERKNEGAALGAGEEIQIEG